MKKKKVLLILFAIILIGAALRFYKLGELSFVADEFLDINSSYAYSQTGIWQSWDFNRGQVNAENEFAPRDERAWLYKIQVAQLFKYFAPTEGVARSISALWGVISIALMFLVAKSMTGKKDIGLISALLFAVSISGLVFDRRLRMYAMFFPLFLLFSWLTFKFYEGNYGGKHKWCKKFSQKFSINPMYLIPAIAIGILSLAVHDLTVSMAAIFATYVLVQAVKSFKKKDWINKYSVTLAVIISLTVALFALAASQIGKYAAGIKFFNDNFSYFSIIFTDYSHPLIAALLVVVGIVYLTRRKEYSKQGLWLAVSFLVPLLMATFLWRRNAGPQYIFFAQSFEIILISTGIYAVGKYFKKNLSINEPKKAFAVAILLLLVVLPNWAYFFEKNNVYSQTSDSENPNYRSIFTYFKKKKNADDVLVTRNFRNYYFSGQNVKVYDFGGELSEEKFPLIELEKIVSQNKSGWVILSNNDERYIANDAMAFMEKNMVKINDVAVRGDVMVYRWGN
ncbi:MAG: hypothetical protein ACD_5C00031G0009 [uncultured bacterium]|nr:MAG: hypothetical protein ACD_5C00031G0009 [uncultured bacterium]